MGFYLHGMVLSDILLKNEWISYKSINAFTAFHNVQNRKYIDVSNVTGELFSKVLKTSEYIPLSNFKTTFTDGKIYFIDKNIYSFSLRDQSLSKSILQNGME